MCTLLPLKSRLVSGHDTLPHHWSKTTRILSKSNNDRPGGAANACMLCNFVLQNSSCIVSWEKDIVTVLYRCMHRYWDYRYTAANSTQSKLQNNEKSNPLVWEILCIHVQLPDQITRNVSFWVKKNYKREFKH